MPNKSLTIEQVLTLLQATPLRLTALTMDLSAEEEQIKPTSDGWSINEVLAHLRACADVWGKCIEEMIAEDRPTLRAVNPRSWIKKMNYRELEFRSSLNSFVAQRDDLLTVLTQLAPEGWERSATVKGAGNVLERNVLFYGRWRTFANCTL